MVQVKNTQSCKGTVLILENHLPLLWFWDSQKLHTSFQNVAAIIFSWQKLTYSGILWKLVTILDKAELRCFNDPSDSVTLKKMVFRLSGTCLHIGRYALNSLGCICTNLLQLRGLSVETSGVFVESMMFVQEPLEDVYHIKQWLQFVEF